LRQNPYGDGPVTANRTIKLTFACTLHGAAQHCVNFPQQLVCGKKLNNFSAMSCKERKNLIYFLIKTIMKKDSDKDKNEF